MCLFPYTRRQRSNSTSGDGFFFARNPPANGSSNGKRCVVIVACEDSKLNRNAVLQLRRRGKQMAASPRRVSVAPGVTSVAADATAHWICASQQQGPPISVLIVVEVVRPEAGFAVVGVGSGAFPRT